MEIKGKIQFPILTEFYADNWIWDEKTKSPDVSLSRDKKAAYFYTDPVNHSTGTAGVRGNKILKEGQHYWEIVFLEPPYGTSVMIGVGTKKAALQKHNYRFVNLLGIDKNSWGLSYKGVLWHNGQSWKYCDPIYDDRTVIGCHLDTCLGTLTFYRNGINLGVAFCDPSLRHEQLYPIISSTATETELAVGKQYYCRQFSLREKCCSIIRNNLSCSEKVEKLPLPNLMKRQIRMT